MVVRTFARLLPLLWALSACTQVTDVKETFKVVDLHAGWYDAGIVDGKNKLVPQVTFQIEKATNDEVRPLAVNILFKKILGQTEEEWDDVFLQRVEFTEGNRTKVLTVQPEAGVTGDAPQTRAQMLQHSQFVDIRAVIFAKQSSTNWVELARYDIPRQLLTK